MAVRKKLEIDRARAVLYFHTRGERLTHESSDSVYRLVHFVRAMLAGRVAGAGVTAGGLGSIPAAAFVGNHDWSSVRSHSRVAIPSSASSSRIATRQYVNTLPGDLLFLSSETYSGNVICIDAKRHGVQNFHAKLQK